MNRLQIDFVQQVNRRRAWPRYGLLLIGCICTAMMVNRLQVVEADLDQLAHEQQALVDADAKARDIRETRKKTADLNLPMSKALAPLIYSWAPLLTQIERAAGEHVNVTRFDHRYDQHAIHMIVNTSNFAEAQLLLSRLNIEGQRYSWTIRSVSRSTTGLKITMERLAL